MSSPFSRSPHYALLMVALGSSLVMAQIAVPDVDVPAIAEPILQVPAAAEVVWPEVVPARSAVDSTVGSTLEAGVSAADEIFRAGNPRNAARQYAILSLRFGASEDLLARRFVAQIAAGEFEQASVIASLARMMDVELTAESLPGRSLLGLGIDPVIANALSEALAEMTVLNRIDPPRLEAVAIWLRLTGENKRSKLFFDKAEELRTSASSAPERIRALPRESQSDLPPVFVPSADIRPDMEPAGLSSDKSARATAPPQASESALPNGKAPGSSSGQGISLVEPLRTRG